jgi:hypothetical protein
MNYSCIENCIKLLPAIWQNETDEKYYYKNWILIDILFAVVQRVV